MEEFTTWLAVMGYSPVMQSVASENLSGVDRVGQAAAPSDSSLRHGHLDFCRKARRLRASAGRSRRLLHEQLSGLRVTAELAECPSSSATSMITIERLDADLANLNEDDTLTWASTSILPVRNIRGAAGVSAVETSCRSGSFADHVAHEMTGPVMHYEQRVGLLREARRRGISRFEANLVIAAVQHRLTNEPRSDRPRVSHQALSTLLAVTAVTAMQSLILLGLYRVIHGS